MRKLALVLCLLSGSALAQNPGITYQGANPAANDCAKFVNRSIVTTAGAACGSGSGLVVGTTAITSGATTKVLFDNVGVLGEYTISGTGNVAMTTSPVFTTPNIGSATGSISGNAATVTTNANLTGGVTSVGNAATVITNANLTGPITSSGNATSIASQTGTGTKFVVDTSPALVTPDIGTATGTALTLSGLLKVGNGTAAPQVQIGTATQGFWAVSSSSIGLSVTNSFNTDFNWTSGQFKISAAAAELLLGTSSDARFGRVAADSFRFGAPNSASPLAQTLQASGSRSGTDTNTGGANMTIKSGPGTGTGAISSLILQSPVVVASGTGAQTQTTGLTIKGGMAVLVGYTVSTLPTGVTGGIAYVTDQLTVCAAAGAALTGGGAVTCPTFYNGSAWVGL